MSRVLVVGDTHCPGMRRGYVDFLCQIAETYQCNRCVHIGDLVDWHSISFHERKLSLSNPEAEFGQAYKQVQELKDGLASVGLKTVDWLIGNHDCLTERQACAVGLPSNVLRDYSDLWGVERWRVHPRYTKLFIDGVIYSHGDSGRGGMDAALTQAKDHFRSTVLGHLHAQAGVKWWANPEYRVFGMSVGCGIDAKKMQFEYGKRFNAKPILGCGVVLNGQRAFFEPWLLPSAKVASKRRAA